MVSLINLPPEIVHNILSFVDPEDLGTIPQTCHALYDFTKGNRALCRDIYHRTLVRTLKSTGLQHVITAIADNP